MTDKELVKNFDCLIRHFRNFEKYKNIEIRDKENIKKIPLIRRDEIEKWNLRNCPQRPFIFYEATGGTEGRNFFLGVSFESHKKMIERGIQMLKIMGVKKIGIHLNLLFSDLIDRSITRFGGSLLSIGDLYSNKRVSIALDAIRKLPVFWVYSCPNQLYDIFHRIGRKHRVRKCLVSGELLIPWFKQAIQRISGVEIYDCYGSSGGFIGIQDNPKDEFMRLLEDGLYFEVLKNNGDFDEVGKGIIIMTDLYNFSTPAIRYVLGDRVEIIKRGRYKYVKILSRNDEYLKLDGELVAKSFIVNEMCKILNDDAFIIVITKDMKYQDVINIFIKNIYCNKQKSILKFVDNNFGIPAAVKIINDNYFTKFTIQKKQYIIDKRKRYE
jgi:phenylacetate-coenzyme A ligase PaaK-like adenylate-forming protein